MTYKLLITQDANNDIDEIISYIVNELKNPIAARNLLSEIESGFEMISFNPHAFPLCNDKRLRNSGYRKITVKIVVFIVNCEYNSLNNSIIIREYSLILLTFLLICAII